MSNTADIPQAPSPRPAIPTSKPETTGDTVTVACKLPHGIVLRVFGFDEIDEPMRDGSWKKIKRPRPLEGLTFTVRGTWAGSAGQAFHRNNSSVAELLPGGYALTQGCPKHIWEQWYAQNQRSMIVRNKIVFAHASHSTIQHEARTFREVRTGMEPLDPSKPGERMPGGVDRRLRIGQITHDEGTSPI